MTRKRRPEDDLAAISAHAPQSIPRAMKADFEKIMPGYPKRHDGWNQERLQRFLDTLAHTGCVEDACRVAGISDVAPYRAKKRYPLFAAAWEDALDRSRQGLIAIAYKRAVEGRETVIIRKGEEYERRIQPSDAMLGLLVKRGDLAGGGIPPGDRDRTLTFAEWQAGWRFNDSGQKHRQRSNAEIRAGLEAKFAVMRARLLDEDEPGSDGV